MAELTKFHLHPGDPAPEFSLPGVDGRTYRLSDFGKDRLLAVVFWCNHCPYVQAWESRLIELARETGPQGVGFVLINANDASAYPDDSFPKMAERSRQKGYPFPYLWDEDQEVAHAYGALVTPHPMLFGPDRRLLFQGRIDDHHDQPEAVSQRYLRSGIEAALAGRPIARPELSVLGCSVKWRS